MKILITGSTGFIGKHLVKELEKDNQIIPWDISDGKNIFFSDLDLSIQDVDVVYHLAAITSVTESFKNPHEVYKVNVFGAAHVAYLCQKYNKKLIYPSSASIYHPELSPYAQSKKMAEDIVHLLIPNTPVTILRLFNVFGPGMRSDSGSIMYNFLTDKEIIVHGDGEQTRDFIHIDDVVSIMKNAIDYDWNGLIMDIGTGQSYSVNYVAGLFAFNRKKRITYVDPVREIKWSVADTALLNTFYKKPLVTNLEENIRSLCQN